MANVETELKNAFYNGKSLWETGFETTILYNLGNDQRRIAAEMIRDNMATLAGGGGKFKVNVVGIDWNTILEQMELEENPFFFIGWLADFADCDNWARPYMHSQGDFAYFQGYNDPYVDGLIEAAIVNANVTNRGEQYQELQWIYKRDEVSIPIGQPQGRRWARDWVKGWYYNVLYPGLYAYDLWKEVSGSAEAVDIDVTSTLTAINTWQRVYRYANGTNFVGYTEGSGPANGSRAIYKFSLSLKRTENNTDVPTLVAAVGLKKHDYNATAPIPADQFPYSTLVLLGPLETKNVLLTWEENGTYATYYQGNHTFMLGARSFVNLPANAYDDNSTNDNTDYAKIHAEGDLTGDLKIDGKVNILDSIVLGIVFGSKEGDANWSVLNDLQPNKKIDILDSIVLGLNFNKACPGPQYPVLYPYT
jgi:hypothetical protein